LTNPRGPISTRFRKTGAPPIAIVAQLNTVTSIVAAQRNEGGLVTMNQVSDSLTGAALDRLKQSARFERISSALTASPQLGEFRIVPEGSSPGRSLLTFTPPGSPDSPDAREFRKAAKAHQDYVSQGTLMSLLVPVLQLMEMTQTREKLLQSLDPERTIKARVQAASRITGVAETASDPLEPILDAPVFPQPMYEALRDLSQDFLFPGLDHVPANTIALLKTNTKFVESFLVGLNDEMDREFLWRDYPTDQRSTFFQQFWDTSAGKGERDIQPIQTWGKNKLGDNARADEKLVLLIRGELLRRYPNSVIYAVKAEKKGGLLDLSPRLQDELPPLFRGTLKPDVTFLGFDLKEADAVADPGWFFVIQQQPTEPSFGLDAAEFDKPLPALTTWNNLSWRHLAATEEALKALSHASTRTTLPVIDNATWGRNAAHQAYITLQRPVRIAIHAKEMLQRG